MIEVIEHSAEPGKNYRRYEVIVPYADMLSISLDPIDRAALAEKPQSAADVLQNLQILAFRQQQQAEGNDLGLDSLESEIKA